MATYDRNSNFVNLIRFDANEIVLRRNQSSILRITNTGAKRWVFKVKTTHNEQVKCSKAYGLLAANGHVDITYRLRQSIDPHFQPNAHETFVFHCLADDQIVDDVKGFWLNEQPNVVRKVVSLKYAD